MQEIRERLAALPWRVSKPIRDAAGNVLLDVGEHARAAINAALRKAGKDGEIGAWEWTGEPIRLHFPDAPIPVADGDLAAADPMADWTAELFRPVLDPDGDAEGIPAG